MKIPRDSTGPGGQGGVVLDLTMQGDGLYHCVYTVPAFLGSSRKQFSVQVDTGSSDMWLASTSCNSQPSCSTFSGPKYDASGAQPTGQNFDVTYHSGKVDGPIVVDTLEIGGYVAKGQALAAASSIQDEILSTGNGFSGLIGLAPQANSIIGLNLNKSSSAHSRSTFATHLFSTTSDSSSGLTTPAPTNKFISLLLERPYYPGVSSHLGLGAHPTLPGSLSTSSIVYSDIIPTNPGPLFWRVPVTRITIDLAGKPVYVSLGGTQAQSLSSIYPIALIDSGGVPMIATRSLANSIYGTWGIGPGKDDGMYYVPCTLAMNVTLTLGSDVSVDVPIHPLDMSMAIASEPGSSTCLGALQASESIPQGDLVLGAAFMRNIYTVLSYQTDPPKLGLLPLVNPTVALSEFNTVRVLHQQLGLSNSQVSNTATGTDTPATGSKGPNIAIPIIAGLAGFVVLAGLAVFLTSRLMHRRARQAAADPGEADESYAAVSHARARDMEITGKEKRSALGKSMYGMEVDEAFTMFSAGGPSGGGSQGVKSDKNSDAGSSISTSDIGDRRRDESAYDKTGEGVDKDLLAAPGGTRPQQRTRNAPYHSIDTEWGAGSMAGLLQDPRFSSVYSINSVNSSVKGTDMNPMQPVDTYSGSGLKPSVSSERHVTPEVSSHPTSNVKDNSSPRYL